jgi:hypothetical protein
MLPNLSRIAVLPFSWAQSRNKISPADFEMPYSPRGRTVLHLSNELVRPAFPYAEELEAKMHKEGRSADSTFQVPWRFDERSPGISFHGVTTSASAAKWITRSEEVPSATFLRTLE